MSRNKDILPIVMGMDPPTKEVILVRTDNPLKGIACFINHARFPDGTTPGQQFSFGDATVEIDGAACWIHFTNTEIMKKFGKMLYDYADKEKTACMDDSEELPDVECGETAKMRPHWISGGDGPFHSDAICSECHVRLDSFLGRSPGCGIVSYPRFCPACGEKMDGPVH